MHVLLGRTLDIPAKDIDVAARVDIGGSMGEARERVGRENLGRDPGPTVGGRGQVSDGVVGRNGRSRDQLTVVSAAVAVAVVDVMDMMSTQLLMLLW